MRVHVNTYWDGQGSRDYLEIQKFVNDVELLDKAHKRAKKELSKQQKAITRKNESIKCYKEMYDNLVKQYSRLNTILVSFQDSKMTHDEQSIKQLNDITNLELKISCLEQENKTLRKQQTNQEKEVQERIIKSMNETIIELREQLTETEEKYNELLKHVLNEK